VHKPSKTEYPPYYARYIDLPADIPLADVLQLNATQIKEFISQLPPKMENYAYADGKWTINEVISHCIDTERVFQFRALLALRGDTAMAPDMDHDNYVRQSHAANNSFSELAAEYAQVRASTLLLFRNSSGDHLDKTVKMSSGEMSARAIGYLLCGHALHHLRVIAERYVTQRTV